MQKLQAIDAVGRKIANGGTFALIGTQAQQSAVKIDGIARSATGVHSTFDRVAHKAVGVGSAIAAVGEVGTSAMEKITHATANVAIGFGPEGAVVAAAAIAAAAIVGIFTRARAEMEKADQEARTLLKNLSLDTGVQRLNELFTGDIGAKPGSPAALGLEKARQRAALLQATTPAQRTNERTGLLVVDNFQAQRDELRELNAWILANSKAYDDTKAKVEKLTATEVGRVSNLIKLDADRKAAEDALTKPAKDQAALTKQVDLALDAARSAIIQADRQIDHISDEAHRKVDELMPLNVIGKLLAPLSIPISTREGSGNDVVGLIDDLMGQYAQEILNAANEVAETIRTGLAQTLGQAIYDGFSAAFSGKGIGGLFKSFAKTMLAGIGGIFKRLGEIYLTYGLMMKAFSWGLTNPFTAGWAGVAIGAALIAMGAALGAVGGSGQGGAGGGAGSSYSGSYSPQPDEVTRIRLMPGWTQAGASVSKDGMNVFAPVIIGTNDPSAQRAVAEMYEKGKRQRG